jgi:hypothetical protein
MTIAVLDFLTLYDNSLTNAVSFKSTLIPTMTSSYSTYPLGVLLLLRALTLQIPAADAAKILTLFIQFPSHTVVKLTIASELVSRGHEVHVILHPENPLKNTFQQNNVKIINYRPVPDLARWFSAEYEEAFAALIFSGGNEIPWMKGLLSGECDAMMSDHAFLELLKGYNFDFVVVEPFISNPCHLLIPNYLRLPYALSTFLIEPLSVRLPALPSFYVPPHAGPYMMEYPTLEIFFHRLANAVKFTVTHLLITKIFWGDKSLIQKYAPEVSSWEELMLRSELILIENDYHLDSAMPLLPHVVTVAGVTARPPQPLPDNLERIMMQSGDDGVILASFGSMAYHMPPDVVIKFLDAFGRLRETVLTRMAIPVGFQV